jgi:hypothetical protein
MESRRKFLKRGLYVTPVVLSLAVRPAVASPAYNPRGGGGNGPPQTSAGGPAWWAFWRD